MKRLTWFSLIAINIFWLGLNLRNNAIGSIFMPYLVERYAKPEIVNTALGVLRTAGLVIAMLVQPAAGILSDRYTGRFGRRRPFIFTGVILDLLFMAALLLVWDYPSLLIVVLLIQVSSNISHGPLQALIPDLVPENQRGTASAIKAIFELLPLVLLGFTIAPLVAAGHLDWAVAAAAAGLVLAMLVTMVYAHEPPATQKLGTPLAPEMLRVLGMLAGILAGAGTGIFAGLIGGGLIGLLSYLFIGRESAINLAVGTGGALAMVVAVVAGVWVGARFTLGDKVSRHPGFIWWIVNRLMFLAAITSIQGFAPFFIMYAFKVNSEKAVAMTGSLITVVGLFTLVSALPAGRLGDRFGNRKLVAVSGWMSGVGTLVLLTSVWAPSLAILYSAGTIIGLAAGLFVTANWALGTVLAPADEAGRFLGVSNLAGAGAGMIGSGLGGPVADFLNQSIPGLGYFAIFSAYGLLFVLSSIVMRRVR